MGIKDTLRKATELFIELDDEESPEGPRAGTTPPHGPVSRSPQPEGSEGIRRSAADAVGDASGADRQVHQPPSGRAAVPESQKPVAQAPADRNLDFEAIYQRAGVPTPGFTAEKLMEMMAHLPAELSIDQKHATVMATLDAMGRNIGVTPETIVADAHTKVAALSDHVKALTAGTAKFVTDASAEVVALQKQIDEKRQAIDECRKTEEEVKSKCQAESARLETVLKFFSGDVPDRGRGEQGETQAP